MSSLGSGANSIAAVLSTGVLSSTSRGDLNDRGLGRPYILTTLAGLLGMGIALVVNYFMQASDWNLVTLMERANLFAAPLGAMFLGGIWSKRIGSISVLIGFACSLLAAVLISFSGPLFGYDISFMWIMPTAFCVGMSVPAIISSLTNNLNSSQVDDALK